MRLLITGGGTPLAVAAVSHLSESNEVVQTAFPGSGNGDGIVHADLRDAEAVASLLTGVNAILHFAPYAPEAFPGGDAERLDAATRGTYTLMMAAREAGVGRTIVAGRLSLFDGYPDKWVIDEGWRPRPEPAIEDLIPHLCETGCREFAREEGDVIGLRFGDLGGVTSEAAAMSAIDGALSLKLRRGRRWELAHVADGSTRHQGRAMARWGRKW